MGLTFIDGKVSHNKLNAALRFLVDSGATYTVLPQTVWKKLKLTPKREQSFILADGTVMNERFARLDFAGKVVDRPVMGVFEFRGDLICAWRDYFDMALLDALGTDVSVPR